MNGRRTFHPRHEFRFGTREAVIFGAGLLLVLGLTFAFGVLVGREFDFSRSTSRPPAEAAEASTPSQAPPPPARPRVEERLTFYQTLTAPTPDLPAVGQPTVEERMVLREPPPAPARKSEPQRAVSAGSASQSVRSGLSPPRLERPAPVEPPPGRWTVQVSSFRSYALAEQLKARLVARGFDAYLIPVATEAGRVHHRVRVGEFPTRAEAERAASELRADRHPHAFVTIRTR